MKRISTTILILAFSAFVFGQDAHPVSTWQEFSPDGEEFVVNIPRKMIERTNRLSNEISKPKTFEIKDQIFLLNNHDKFNISDGESFKIESDENIPNLVPIKIISKPRANFTDLARSYRLNGTAIFKATFTADGIIENITPLKKLPFGLTDSVKEAIEKIKFEPAMKDGVPQSTTRLLNYSFEIF